MLDASATLITTAFGETQVGAFLALIGTRNKFPTSGEITHFDCIPGVSGLDRLRNS
jgi:hypothetical protein